MYTLRSLDVLSVAKVMGVLYGCIGLIILPFLLLAGVASLLSQQQGAAISGVGMLAFAILAPIFYGVLGFLSGALMAWIYNLVARRIGGVRMDLGVENVISAPAVS